MLAAKENNPACKIVVIDPRRTATCEGADLHLPLRSGSDSVLFNGLFAFLAGSNAVDRGFVGNCTTGVVDALKQVAGQTVAQTAATCGLTEGAVGLFFDWFTRTERVVTLYSQGINQSSSGVDKVNAIINCHLLTGRIGRPGMGPFSLTGQPNAMGGREVGGLANQLAAHMEIENPSHRELVQRFWRAPVIAEKAGLKAVDMFDAIADGRIKAVWIISTNPVVSLPDADRARAALDACELVVVTDCMRDTDTTRHADVLLPALAWGEKDGTVTNSERRISRQRPFLAAPGEARADWRIVCDVATRMGYAGFDYASAAAVFREHAGLSGFENDGRRDFDISALAALDDVAYDALAPVQWPVTSEHPAGTPRMFGSQTFFTPDRKARFVPVAPRAARHATSRDFPLVLNTGRVRDQWHTMTRTGKTGRLLSHVFEPYAEFHPDDARQAGVQNDGLVRLTSNWGEMIARVVVTADQRRGCVFVPMHWNEAFAGEGPRQRAGQSGGRSAVRPAGVEAHAGQGRSIRAEMARLHPEPAMRSSVRWVAIGSTARPARARGLELALDVRPESWRDWARAQLGLDGVEIEWLAYRDPAAGRFRYAAVRDGRLAGCVFIAPDHALPSRAWLTGLFAEQQLSANARMSLLAGRPFGAGEDVGPIVCSCFSVGRHQITAEIRKGAASVEAIGRCLKAGTNCGGCKPEIGKLIGATAQPRQAVAS
jgi:assimilatory nitrate reductase catalytic subunit